MSGSVFVSPYHPVQQSGVRALNPPDLVIADRAPSNANGKDYAYFPGTLWLYVGNALYVQLSQVLSPTVKEGNWNIVSAGGGVVASVVGTSNQVTVVTSAGTATVSLPSVLVAPGSISTTGALSSGSTLSVTTNATVDGTLGVTGATTLAGLSATSGTFSSTLGVSGASTLAALSATTGSFSSTLGVTGAATFGSTVATHALTVTGSINASTTITAGTGITATTGNIAASAGSVTAGTTLTATLGNITATNGNLNLATAGNKLFIATGSNASAGTSAAMTAGTITISTTAVTASSLIILSVNTPGGTQGILSAPSASIVNGTSFVINSSSGSDTSTVNWWFVN